MPRRRRKQEHRWPECNMSVEKQWLMFSPVRVTTLQGKPDQLWFCTDVHLQGTLEKLERVQIESSRPEWCISSMIYSRDTPFWLETLGMGFSENYLMLKLKLQHPFVSSIYTLSGVECRSMMLINLIMLTVVSKWTISETTNINWLWDTLSIIIVKNIL